MTKSTRKLLLVMMFVLLIVAIFAFVACQRESKFKLTFVVDGKTNKTIYTNGNEAISLPNSPTKDNCSFDGWYLDIGEWKKPFVATSMLDEPITSDLRIYAKFTPNKLSGVTFVDVVTTYDGTNKTIAVKNLPSGAKVVYNKANTYVNAGKYVVTATITKENYEELQLTATLTINKAVYDMSGVVFASKTVNYDGASHSIFASNLPKGVSVTYENNGKTNIGSYVVVAKFSGDNKNYEPIPNKTANLTISVISFDSLLFESAKFTYDGLEKTIEVQGVPSGATVTYDKLNKQTNAGEYKITAIINMEGYATVTLTATLTIEKAVVSGLAFEDKTVTYNGSQYRLAIEGKLPEDISVDYANNGKTNVGVYTVIATFSSNSANYITPDDMVATLTIKKAVYDMSNVSFENNTVTYDGNPHVLSISGTLPDGVTVSYVNNEQTNANQYVATASFVGDAINYFAIDDMQAILTINKATYDMRGVSFLSNRFIYDGTPKSIYVSGNLPDGVSVTYINNEKVDANTYTVTAKFAGDSENYNKLSDWTASLIIDKATYDMNSIIFGNQTFTYDATEKNAVVSGTLPQGVKVVYEGNGKIDVGEYLVTARFQGDYNNYNLIEDKTATLKIKQAVPYIKEVSCDQTINIHSNIVLIADTIVAGTVALDEKQVLSVGFNTYKWTFTPEDTHNYTKATGTIGLTVCALVSYYNDGILYESQNVVPNNSAFIPEQTPSKNDANGLNYTFSHWSIEENGDEYAFTNVVTADLNLYAVYDSEEIVYAINYYNTKGVENTNIKTYTVSMEHKLSNLEKEHYVFNGWVDGDGHAVTEIAKGTYGMLNLYANWSPVEYSITYVLGYRGARNNAANQKTYNVEDSFSLGDASYDEYHAFVGWYLDKNFINEKTTIYAGEVGNLVLYAKWNFSGTFITTAEGFKNITYNMSGVYELKNDINIDFTLGDSTNGFSGYLNGNDHTVTGTENCLIYKNNGYVGYLKTNKQFCIENYGTIDVVCGEGIASYNEGHIKNSSSTGFTELYYNHYVGGIASVNEGIIENCAVHLPSDEEFKCAVNLGGIAGRSYKNAIIRNCYVDGSSFITMKNRDNLYVYGIAGGSDAYAESCYVRTSFRIQGPNSWCTYNICENSFNSVRCCYVFNYKIYDSDRNYRGGDERSSCGQEINLTSANWLRSNMGWDENIWHFEDGKYAQLWFEVE